jgi:hypothetical protein
MIPFHAPECITDACFNEKHICCYPCILEGGYGKIHYPYGEITQLQRVWVNQLGVITAHEIRVIDASPYWWLNFTEATGKQSFLMHKSAQDITTSNAQQFYFEYHVYKNNNRIQMSRVQVNRIQLNR